MAVVGIITIYSKNETSFTHNGLGILNPTLAEVTEELNGMFSLKLICYAVNNIRVWEYLEDDYIIKVHTPRGYQLFRIFNVVKKINNQVTVNARHIFYDLLYNDVKNITLTNVNADTALKTLLANTTIKTSFTVSSNITTAADISILDTDFITAIFDNNSDKITGIISTYGGEILRDNFDIKLQASIGVDNGFTIAYRKNLTGLDYTISSEDIVTRIKPIASTRNGAPLYLPEVYIDSPYIDAYFMPKAAIINYQDIRVGSGYTTATAYEEMRKRANEMYLVNKVDEPKINAKVNFVLLQDVGYKILDSVNLGDVVAIQHTELGLNLKAKCIKYQYNCILKRYKSIELGYFKDEIATTFKRSIAQANNSTDTNLKSHIENTAVHLSETDREWLDTAKETGIGGGGAVKSVNNKTGDVTITKADIDLGNVTNALQATKAEFDENKTTVNNSLESLQAKTNNSITMPTFNADTYTITFTTQGGITQAIDLPIESLTKDLSFDTETSELIITKADGTEIRIPITGLISVYTGGITSEIEVSISQNNKITAALLNNSIAFTKLDNALQQLINGLAAKEELTAVQAIAETAMAAAETALTDISTKAPIESPSLTGLPAINGIPIMQYTESTSTNDTYVATIEGMTSYIIGQPILLKATIKNTTAATLNINGLGAKAIRRITVALKTGDIIANSIILLVYDGTYFQLLSQSGSLTATQLQTTLTGLSTATTEAITTSDTIIGGMGKLQAQITTLENSVSGDVSADIEELKAAIAEIKALIGNPNDYTW